jgi:hypothetical protein
MPIEHVTFKMMQVNYICDECNKGRMIPTGAAYMCHPARYIHKCYDCGNIQELDYMYPRQIYIDKSKQTIREGLCQI